MSAAFRQSALLTSRYQASSAAPTAR